jgi:hypothetical protein
MNSAGADVDDKRHAQVSPAPMIRAVLYAVGLLLIFGVGRGGAWPMELEEGKAWAFEVRAKGATVFVGAWTRDLCETALQDSHKVENPRIQAIGSCLALSFMGEQVGLEVWMVEPEADKFILFPSRETCEDLTAQVHEGATSRPSCSRVWVRIAA